MKYLLDTKVCIVYLNDSHSQVVQKLRSLKPDNVFWCQVMKAELVYGAYKSLRQAENLALLKQFFSQFTSLPFHDKNVREFSRISQLKIEDWI